MNKNFTFLALLFFAFILFGDVTSHHANAKPADKKATFETMTVDDNMMHLADSPYLRKYAKHPVNWKPWTPEVLALAQKEDKPIFMTIGYSSCYWCHYMKDNVFNRPDIAKKLNENFINIVIDRETRPDIDKIYIQAVLIMNKDYAAWPLNFFLQPDLKPFFASGPLMENELGPYLDKAASDWKTKRKDIEQVANHVDQLMRTKHRNTVDWAIGVDDDREPHEKYYTFLSKHFDKEYGSFGEGIKTLPAQEILFLQEMLQSKKKDKDIPNMLTTTADGFLMGAINDHVGGGFHRYAEDRKWLAPHFEKMLHTQGFALDSISALSTEFRNKLYEESLTRTYFFLISQMQDPRSYLFYSSIVATDETPSSRYYSWDQREINKILGGSKKLNTYEGGFNLTSEGLIYKTTPYASKKMADMLKDLRLKRNKRRQPSIDKKAITSWNGIVIHGLAKAGGRTGNMNMITTAEFTGNALWSKMWDDKTKTVKRFYFEGKALQDGFLDDYVWLARSNVALYEVTKKRPYLNRALHIIQAMDQKFYMPQNRNYAYADKANALPIKIFKNEDSGDLPSPNAQLVHLFLDIYEIEKNDEWFKKAQNILQATAQEVSRNIPIHGSMIYASMRYSNLMKSKKLLEAAQNGIDPRTIVKIEDVTITPRQPNEWILDVTIDIKDGWYITSNEPSLDFLVPSRINAHVKDIYSNAVVRYPASIDKDTPLGLMKIYEDDTIATINLKAQDAIPLNNLRVVLEFQTCSSEGECLPPTKTRADKSVINLLELQE